MERCRSSAISDECAYVDNPSKHCGILRAHLATKTRSPCQRRKSVGCRAGIEWETTGRRDETNTHRTAFHPFFRANPRLPLVFAPNPLSISHFVGCGCGCLFVCLFRPANETATLALPKTRQCGQVASAQAITIQLKRVRISDNSKCCLGA
jgi:hypothetical protein